MSTDPTQALIDVYHEAYLSIAERIATKQARGSAARYERALLSEIGHILTDLDVNTRAWIIENVPAIYLAGMQETVQQLALDGLAPPSFTATLGAGINQQAVQIIAQNLYSDLSDANVHVGRQVQDMFRQAGIATTAAKVSQNLTITQSQAQMQQALRAAGITGFTDKRGRRWQLDRYAEMTIRSSSAETTNRGRMGQMTEFGYDLVTIPPHTPTCKLCAPYQGRVYSISGRDERFPALFGTAFGEFANIHPNCEHRVAPWIESLQSDDERESQLANAGKPFDVDPRSEAERTAFEAEQAKKRLLREDRDQWQRYKAVLPDDAPSTLSAWRRMKQANSPKYQQLQSLYREANRLAKAQSAP